MKYFINLLILLPIISLGGVDPAEGKVCFIVDAKGNCNGGKVEKFKQDCSARGYTQICDTTTQDAEGGSCTQNGITYHKSCQCKNQYKFVKNDGDEGKYDFGDSCTVNGVTKYSYKRCKSAYAYAASAIPNLSARNVLAATACVKPAELKGNTCEEEALATGGAGPLRYTQCVCPSDYKYTTSNVGEGFAVKGEACKDSEGEKYWNYQCASNYVEKGKCPDGQKDFNGKLKGNLRCVQCTNLSCSDYNYTTAAQSCTEGAYTYNVRGVEYTLTLPATDFTDKTVTDLPSGSSTISCHTCAVKTCNDYVTDNRYRFESRHDTGDARCGSSETLHTDKYQNDTLYCSYCRTPTCDDYEGYQDTSCGAGFKELDRKDLNYGIKCYQCEPYTCETHPSGYEGECSSKASKVLPSCRSINLCSDGYEVQITNNVQLGTKIGSCYKCVNTVMDECTCLDRMLQTIGKYCRYDGTGYRLEDSGCSN